MKKPESRLQKRIKEHLEKSFGGVWHKIHGGPYQSAGIGDLVGCCKGYYFNLEVKQDKPGKKYEPTEIQQKEIEDVIKEGGCGACVKSPEQAEQVVRKYLEQKALHLPKKSSKKSNVIRVDWSVDGAGNRKDIDSLEICWEPMEKEFNK